MCAEEEIIVSESADPNSRRVSDEATDFERLSSQQKPVRLDMDPSGIAEVVTLKILVMKAVPDGFSKSSSGVSTFDFLQVVTETPIPISIG